MQKFYQKLALITVGLEKKYSERNTSVAHWSPYSSAMGSISIQPHWLNLAGFEYLTRKTLFHSIPKDER